MNLLKRKAFSYLEKATAKKGFVLDVRAWEPATMFEVDLHLPDINMNNWQSVQHIKVKVGDMTYRDYSPAMWDCETKTCTLIIDAGHSGMGANWIKNLKSGDEIIYLGVASTGHKPIMAGNIFCLGDASSIGHFLALEQLSKGGTHPFSGMIALDYYEHQLAFQNYFQTFLQPVTVKDKVDMFERINQYGLSNETVYIAGCIPVMSELRKKIKQLDHFKGQIKLQGFWS
jgi:NADPH-dependent ferric siderophore reductase